MKKITISVEAVLNRIYAASALNTFVNIDSATCHATLSPANDAPLRILIPDVLIAVLGAGVISHPCDDGDTVSIFVADAGERLTQYIVEAAVANRIIADMLAKSDDASSRRFAAYSDALENRIAAIFSDEGIGSVSSVAPSYY